MMIFGASNRNLQGFITISDVTNLLRIPLLCDIIIAVKSDNIDEITTALSLGGLISLVRPSLIQILRLSLQIS